MSYSFGTDKLGVDSNTMIEKMILNTMNYGKGSMAEAVAK